MRRKPIRSGVDRMLYEIAGEYSMLDYRSRLARDAIEKFRTQLQQCDDPRVRTQLRYLVREKQIRLVAINREVDLLLAQCEAIYIL